MKKTFMVLSCVLTASILVGCASTKGTEKKSSKKADGPIKTVAVDWQNKSLGKPQTPEWLSSVVDGDYDSYKTQFRIDKDRRVVKVQARSSTESRARVIAMTQNSTSLAQELNQKVIAKVGAGLNDVGEQEALYVAASKVRADMGGWHEGASHWVHSRITDYDKGTVKDVFDYYIVYDCSKEVWENLVKQYLLGFMKEVPDTKTQKAIGSLYSELVAEEKENNAEKRLAELREYKLQMAKAKSAGANIPPVAQEEQEMIDAEEALLTSYLQ